MSEMVHEIAPGWDLVAQKTNLPLLHMFFILLQMLMMSEPVNRSSVTFTVRNRASGEVRTVTAASAEEAAIRITQGHFDRK